MRLQAIIFILLIAQFGYGQLRQPRKAVDRQPERAEKPVYPDRYTAPVEHDDIIVLYNLSSSYNPVVIEVRDNREPDMRRVLTGGWLGPFHVILLPVQQISGDGLAGEPWKGTLWAFSGHRISIMAGDSDHVHTAVRVPEHYGIQVNSYWSYLLAEGH